MKRQTWQTASFGEGDRTARRVQFIVILALIAALAVSLALLIPNLGVRGGMQQTYLMTMLQEANSAVSEAKQLSRNSGMGSMTPLTKIRSSVAVIKAMNNAYRESGAQDAISDDFLDSVLTQVDQFIDYMKTNVNSTGTRQTQLQNDLELLQTQINEMMERRV